MSVQSKINKIRLNTRQGGGELEARLYAFRFKVFSPTDLQKDKVIAELFRTYVKNGAFKFKRKPARVMKKAEYRREFNEHLKNVYNLTDAQIKGAESFKPEQINLFRERLSKHLC